MPLRVSVLVPPTAAASRSLLTSLDRQSLAAADFEVLIADDEQAPDLTARLEDLAAHRTNLARVPVAPGADVAAALLERARGEYVAAVPAGRTLASVALAELCDRADATGADVCVGLTGRAASRPDQLPSAPDEVAVPAGGVRRRTAATSEQVAADLAGGDVRVDGAATVAGILCFLDGPPPEHNVPSETDRSVRAGTKAVTWSDGVVEVVAELTEAAADVRASVYSLHLGVEWPLTDVSVEGTRITLRIDPENVAGPGRLPNGTWWPSLRIDGRPAILLNAPPRIAHGATLGDRPVVSFSRGSRLGLDVGAHGHQPIRRLDPATTTVVEDSRGSLLTSPLANVDLPAGRRRQGQLRLGDMPVVAWLEHADGTGPVLRAWVSGLAGEAPLHTRFSQARFRPTATKLVIDGAGRMRVAVIPRERAAKRPTPPAPPAPAPRGPVARARRLAGRVVRSVRR